MSNLFEGKFYKIDFYRRQKLGIVAFSTMLHSVVIKIEIDDGLPTKICTKCAGLLVKFFKFRNIVIKNDTILRQNLLQSDKVIKTSAKNGEQTVPVTALEVQNTPLKNIEEDTVIDNKSNKKIITKFDNNIRVKKKHQCDICGNFLSCKSSLKQHAKCHTGEKPFECDSCPKRFTRLEHLKTHKRIHTGNFRAKL